MDGYRSDYIPEPVTFQAIRPVATVVCFASWPGSPLPRG